MTKRVMILATDGFEQSELMKPKENMEKAGIETTVVSLESGEIKGWDQKDWGKSVKVDKTVDEIDDISEYDALQLPGGQMNPDILRMNEKAVGIVRKFADAGKPIDRLRSLMAESNVTDAELQKVVADKGHYAADAPIDSYSEKFISGWLLKYWPQILNLINADRTVLN